MLTVSYYCLSFLFPNTGVCTVSFIINGMVQLDHFLVLWKHYSKKTRMHYAFLYIFQIPGSHSKSFQLANQFYHQDGYIVLYILLIFPSVWTLCPANPFLFCFSCYFLLFGFRWFQYLSPLALFLSLLGLLPCSPQSG